MEDKIVGQWRKATFSGNGGGDCVEVANSTRAVLVRDSKDRDSAILGVPAEAWADFIASLR